MPCESFHMRFLGGCFLLVDIKIDIKVRLMPKPRSKFSISRYTYNNGKRAWLVSGTMRHGLRVRRFFEDYDKAERCRQQIEFSEKSETEVDTYAKTRLTSGQVADAEMAYQLLKKVPIVSLSEAVDYCIKNYVEPGSEKSVDAACAEFLKYKAKENLTERTLGELRQFTNKLNRAFGQLKLHQVTSEALDGMIPENASAQTRKNYITKCGQLFNWAIKFGYVTSNPLDVVAKPKVEGTDNVALTLAQTKAVLKAAYGTPIQSLVALQLFAGLRNQEAKRLDWEQVDSEDLVIKVLPKVAKKRDVRTVELEAAILPWLDTSQPIVPEVQDGVESSYRYRKAFEQMRVDAKITDRKYDNVLRHTALSFYSAKTQSLDKTVHWGGTGVGPFFKNYKSLVVLKDVEAYWNLTPESLGLSKNHKGTSK